MAVPESVRNVKRPKNTVVIDNGRPGPHQYAVRIRAYEKYVPGGNPQPVNGKVIGHIVDGSFVPIREQPACLDMLSYGASAFVKSVSNDILPDLLNVYPANIAYAIMAIATLRVIKPGICSNRLSTHYNRTFVCKDYPGVALSANTVGKLLQLIGQDGQKRKLFYHRRIDAVMEEHHIAIDSTLKQDTSRVNDLSAFSYKARVKGCKEISVLYAYDIELMEPICAEVFPGNCNDASSYASFIRDNDIQKGIIVSDKGFPPSCIQNELKNRPFLHFLTPIRRNDTRIASHDMLAFTGVLEGIGKHILYKKEPLKGGRFLYAFRDIDIAANEERAFLARAEAKRIFDLAYYEKKKPTFGVIVFESDQNHPPDVVYKCYDDRWILELVFAQYKGDECLDKTGVEGDFSVIGSEFINFISTVATCRMIRKAGESGVLKDVSYGDLMEDLLSAWRLVDAPLNPASDDGGWIHTLPMVFKELEALGLSKPALKPMPKKRGRPKKEPAETKSKKPRGRPRKQTISS